MDVAVEPAVVGDGGGNRGFELGGLGGIGREGEQRGELGVQGGVGYAYEFAGTTFDAMSMEERMTVQRLADNTWAIEVRYGFREEPDIPEAPLPAADAPFSGAPLHQQGLFGSTPQSSQASRFP